METLLREPEEMKPVEEVRLEDYFLSPLPPEPEWESVWTMLTEPRHVGLGEGLVTEVWTERQGAGDRGQESGVKSLESGVWGQQQQPKTRQEEKEAQLAPERRSPDFRFDGRREGYFRQMAEARRKAKNALVDPYTDLVCEFAEVNPQAAAWERAKVNSYGYAGEANLRLGKAGIVNWSLREAEASFQRAVKADPHDPEAWRHLGIVRLFRRRPKGAVEALKTALDCRAGDARSRISLGMAHYHNQDYAAAEDCFRYEIGPDDRGTGARSFLICSLRMQGKWDQARMQIQALAQHPLAGWKEMAAQCSRCVDRGEGVGDGEKQRRTRFRAGTLVAILGGLFVWITYFLNEFRRLAEAIKKVDWKAAALPAAWLVIMLAQHLRRGLKQQTSKEVLGDGESDMPCWQTRTWMRPQRLDIFGHPGEIERR